MVENYTRFIKDIPVMPAVAAKILSMAEDAGEISFRELENIIKIDQGLAARILKVANSAMYARQREIKNLQMAITLLGFKNIRNLVLLITASRMFTKISKTRVYQDLWRHSVFTGFLAKEIANRCGHTDLAEEAFIASLFHDIGKIALFFAESEIYEVVLAEEKRGNEALSVIESNAFQTDHKKVGAVVLNSWNFPEVFVDSAAEHDSVNITSPHKNLIILLTMANCIEYQHRVLTRLGRGDGNDPGKIQHAELRFRSTLVATLTPYTCLTKDDVSRYSHDLVEILSADPLFKESLGLFDIDAMG